MDAMYSVFRLNPCFNGIKIKDDDGRSVCTRCSCLNPCFNGIKIKGPGNALPIMPLKVLILVLME